MTDPMTPRPAVADDIPSIAAIADVTLFPGDLLDEMIAPFLGGAAKARWWAIEDGGAVIGFAFAAVEPMTDGSWNLKAIAVDPSRHRCGAGRALLAGVEAALAEEGARVLVIDTSSGDDQIAARAFYDDAGYARAGVIPDFWEPGEDKVTFIKAL